jgi:uncharacterized protein
MTPGTTGTSGGRVLIKGASSGIGRELARQLAPRAETLVLVARRRDRLEALRTELAGAAPGGEVLVEPCDLSDAAALEALCACLLARLGGIDLLVNNAGLGDLALFERSEWGRIERILRVNVVAPTLLIHRFLPGMVARRRGGILNVGSGAGFNLMPGAAAYVGSKHYLNGFTETLRAETEGTGVVVTQVAPGPVQSEFDEAAGIEGGLGGGADDFMKIGAEACARDAIRGFDRGEALVFPGRAYALVMAAQAVAPRRLRRRMARGMAARLRRGTAGPVEE